MPRPPLQTETFANDVATVQRVSRKVAGSNRPPQWRAEVCKHLNEAIRMLNEDATKVLTDAVPKRAAR